MPENRLPAGLTADPNAYNEWFKTKVREAREDNTHDVPYQNVTADMKRLAQQDLQKIVEYIAVGNFINYSTDNAPATYKIKLIV